MDYTKAISAVETHLTSGQALTTEIEVDGQRIRFQSMTEILSYLDRLRAEQAASTATSDTAYGRWRIQITNPGDGGV